MRIREIKFKEKFIAKENLYPGDYIKEIALNIIKSNKDIEIKKFDESFEVLKKFFSRMFYVIDKK